VLQNEQHADCQAGIFAAVEEAAGNLQMGDPDEAYSSLCDGGDRTGWFDPNGHGTCQDRVNAFRWGYSNATTHLAEICGPAAQSVMVEICRN
jgi:predicted metalloprotease